MASFHNIVLTALFFLIATTPRAHGVIIGNIAQVQVAGLVSCVVPGTLPSLTSRPLAGVRVNVTCNGGTVTLGQALTNPVGLLNATFSITEGLLLDTSTCVATVNVSDIASCSLLPPTGILRTTLNLVTVVGDVAQLVLGLIFSLV